MTSVSLNLNLKILAFGKETALGFPFPRGNTNEQIKIKGK